MSLMHRMRSVYIHRNKIRLDLLPILKKFNPNIVETLARKAALLNDEDKAGRGTIASLSEAIITDGEKSVAIDGEEFKTLPHAYKRRLLKKLPMQPGASIHVFSVVQLEEAISFMESAETGRIFNCPEALFSIANT